MGKRIAEKQLTQLNQHEEEMEGSSDHFGEGIRMADKMALSQRVIKKPKSRLRGIAGSTATGASEQPSKPSGAFSGFAGFGSPVSTASTNAASSANVATTPTSGENTGGSDSASKGIFKGFSFAQPPAAAAATGAATGAAKPKVTSVPAFGSAGSFGSSNSVGGVSTVFNAGSFGSNNATAKQPAASFETPFSSKATAANDDAGSTQKKSPFSFGATNPTASKQPGLEHSPMDADSKPATGFSMPAFKPPTLGASTSGSSMFSGTQKQSSSFSTPFMAPKQAAADTSNALAATEPELSASNEEEFYRNIRGLNVSLQKKIGDAVSANAFVDLTPLLEQYANHWNLITKKQPAGNSSTSTAPKSAFDNKASTSLGSKPAVAATPFTTPSTTASASATSTFAFSQPAAKNNKPKPLSPAPASEKKFTPSTNAFSSSAMETSPKPPISTPFKFGATNMSAGSKSNFAFSFGKPPLPQQQSPSAPVSDDAAKKPFSFGFLQAGSPTKTTAAGGAPATKPVFTFGFGNTDSTIGGADKVNNQDTKASISGAAEGDKNDVGMNGGDDDDDNDEEPRSPKKPSTAGEEGETTEHQVRAKVYMWDGRESKYKDMGVGQLKVNTWETTDAQAKRARVLCRQEGSNKITLNASLFKEMIVEYTAGKKELGFLVIVDGKPTRYLIRTSSSDSTATLHECIERVKLSL
ncbi:hypothetical protein EV178_005847 [Coemansia sp. RSA 1646]|nr:hypothetical protein EV178_005847 [Coemansia sp. RSA 1646]